MAITVVEVVLYLYCILALLIIVYRYRRTIQLFDHVPFGEMRQMFRFASRTRNVYLLYFALLGAGFTIVFAWVGSFLGIPSYPPSLIIVILITVLFTFMGICQPPAVVLLTSSSPHSANLLERTNLAIFPLKAVALLDYERLHPLQRFDSRNNLRVTNPQVWKSLVHQLVEITPIVVIDTRGEGPGVVEETFIMLAPERVRKVIFITAPDGSCSTLAAYGINPTDYALRTVTEEELIPLLFQMTQSTYHLPWPIEISNQHTSQPILPENLDTFPSMLMVVIIDTFDSEEIVDMAHGSGEDLIALLLPGSKITQGNSQRLWTLLWEFVHDPRLAFMIFEPFDGILIRTRFLVEVAGHVRQHVAHKPLGPLTLEQLFDVDPILNTVDDFVTELKGLANQRGYTYRVVQQLMYT